MVSRGVGPNEVDVRLRRPGFESGGHKTRQILFSTSMALSSTRPRSVPRAAPCPRSRNFLGGWNLDSSDEDALIYWILATSTPSNIKADPSGPWVGPPFAVDIRNSRDDGDRWGAPNVTCIITGGTRDELDFDTVGLAGRWTQATSRRGDWRGPPRSGECTGRLGSADDQRLRHAGHRHDRPRRPSSRIHRLARGGTPPRQLDTAPGNGVTGIMDTAHVNSSGSEPTSSSAPTTMATSTSHRRTDRGAHRPRGTLTLFVRALGPPSSLTRGRPSTVPVSW